ncbi:discoidin domain-containing protein [Chloroflexota bacterium]
MGFTKLFQNFKVSVFATFILLLIAAACSPSIGSESASNIRSLEEVYASGAPEMTEITASDAVLRFESNLPLACSVIYGETTNYGLNAVDQDMDGGAHTNHHPILTGLEPDTEYQFRLQGTAADGTIYISENLTFRTPSQDADVEINLASLEAGARVTAVSSNFGGATNQETWGADSAIDGNRATAWSSNNDGNDAFIEIDLAQPAHLDTVQVWMRSMSNDTAQIFSFTLTTDTSEVLGPFLLDDAEQSYRFNVDVVAKSLRLDVVDSNGGNTGLIEFEVYGIPEI